jgi:hypothetical protein
VHHQESLEHNLVLLHQPINETLRLALVASSRHYELLASQVGLAQSLL